MWKFWFMGIFWAVLGLSLAQLGPVVERVYDVRDLMTRPGTVILTPGFLTIVDVDEQVEQAVSARSDLFEIRVFGNSIYLRPTKRAGTTDLVVTAGGRVFILRLVVDERNFTTYRYRIRFPYRDAVDGSKDLTPLEGSRVQARGEGGEKGSEFGLSVDATFVLSKAGEGILVSYTLINRGKNPVVADPTRVVFSASGGERMSFRLLTREASTVPGRLLPGESERGMFLVDRYMVPIEMKWTLTEVGTGKQVVVGGRWAEVK